MDQKNRSVKFVKSGVDLDEFCDQNKYTNDSLANELDVSRATIFNWKRDQRGLPRIVSLALQALQLDPELRSANLRQEVPTPLKHYRRKSYNPVSK